MAEGLFYHQALRALTAQGVRFVVVGGVAVNLQGVPRFTADLDVAIAINGDNLQAAARALLGMGLVSRIPIQVEQLADIDTVQTWIDERNLRALTYQDRDNPLRQVDLLLATTVPYDEIERDAETMQSGDLEIRVASVDVLIRLKTGTGRAQDASDIDALRRVQELDQ